MGKYLCKLDNLYFEWSDVVDAPVTYGLTRDELRAYVEEEYGRQGLAAFASRMVRVEAKGTSSHLHESVDDLVRRNRAGPLETCLTLDELKAFLRSREHVPASSIKAR